ncbi:MAG TPA: hypothetical protein VFQ61_09270, partial [Polyangiaceae bacterium]|nr:hypothetical protein [Polyangiaceae bacterium]
MHPSARSGHPAYVKRRQLRGLVGGLLLVPVLLSSSSRASPAKRLVVSASAAGAEGVALSRQIDRFARAHPGVEVSLSPVPESADERHQLYVQWLNAAAPEPDVLQLDVIWLPEFAAAG